MVFDHAMEEINSFWNGRKFDGHEISSSHQPCRRQSAPYDDYETVHKIISSGSKAKITEDDELHQELLFAIQHLHKRPRELCIVKCDKDTCLHCSTHPVQAVQAVKTIRENKGPLLTPTPSTVHPGHFMTYLETSQVQNQTTTAPCRPSWRRVWVPVRAFIHVFIQGQKETF